MSLESSRGASHLGLLLLLVSCTLACSRQSRMLSVDNTSPQQYQLVWSDEFTNPGPLSDEDWSYELGFVRNYELQYYQKENAYCRDGRLVIEAKRETVANQSYEPETDDRWWRKKRKSAQYTSASVTTEGKHAWKYGRFEVRAKIDTAKGLWPAFWTLGQAGEWPERGEVDILEYYSGYLLNNAAWASRERWEPKWDSKKTRIKKITDENWFDEFHVWRMDWTNSYIRLYVDDRLMHRISLRKTRNERGAIENPFRQPHYLILNLAVGGTQGGDPSNTSFPRYFEIDYVRVYQLSESDNR